MKMKRYEIIIRTLITIDEDTNDHRYEFRRFESEKEAKAYMWTRRPAGKPTQKSSFSSERGYDSRTWRWGEVGDKLRIEIEFIDHGLGD